MKRAVLPGIFILVVFHHFGVRVGVTQVAVASFDDPRCNGEMVCPDTRLLFTCTVTGSSSASATVKLPSEPAVAVTSMNMTNGPLPDGVTISSHNVVGSGPVNYSLTLSIERADILDDMAVICDAQSVPAVTDEATCPIATDQPGPPVNLSPIVSAITESSAVVQWERPEETGGSGISISSYTVTVSGGQIMPESVSDDGRQNSPFSHTISGLDYETDYTVRVVAINSCGDTSQPATIDVFIDAEKPPQPTIEPIKMDCRVPLRSGRQVVVNWMNGMGDENLIYPQEEDAIVKLTPGNLDCQGVTDNSCNATINEETDYTVSLTLTNNIGSSNPVTRSFNSAIISASVINSDSGSLKLTVDTSLCLQNVNIYKALVHLGDEDDCMLSEKTEEFEKGKYEFSYLFPSKKSYCYTVTLTANDTVVTKISESGEFSSNGGSSGSAAVIAGGAAGGLLLILIIAAVVVLVILVKRPGSKKGDKPGSPAAVELVDSPPAYQDPNTIFRAPHPTTGELYTQVDISSKRKEDPSTIEHQEAPGGELYAMPQKASKKGKKTKKEDELSEEEKAALYSVPDRKGQKAKSEGLTYAQLDIQPSGKQAPPSQGSTYADIRYNN